MSKQSEKKSDSYEPISFADTPEGAISALNRHIDPYFTDETSRLKVTKHPKGGYVISAPAKEASHHVFPDLNGDSDAIPIDHNGAMLFHKDKDPSHIKEEDNTHMENTEVKDLLSAAIEATPAEFSDTFKNILLTKIRSAIADKKIEISHNVMNKTPEESDE